MGNTNYDINPSFVGKYNADTGAAIAPTLITGAHNPFGVAVSGSSLLVTYDNISADGLVGEYAFDGTLVTNPLITESFHNFAGIAVSDSSIYLTISGIGSIGRYDMTTGSGDKLHQWAGLPLRHRSRSDPGARTGDLWSDSGGRNARLGRRAPPPDCLIANLDDRPQRRAGGEHAFYRDTTRRGLRWPSKRGRRVFSGTRVFHAQGLSFPDAI